jgi:hypothetical protein
VLTIDRDGWRLQESAGGGGTDSSHYSRASGVRLSREQVSWSQIDLVKLLVVAALSNDALVRQNGDDQ